MPEAKATFAGGVLAESALRQLTDLWSFDIGRRTQSVSDSLFDVLAPTPDHGCRWNGCTVNAGASDTHHAKHWADGGTTDQSNLTQSQYDPSCV